MKQGKDYIGVSVGAYILNENNELLLMKRNKEPEKGKWSIPGGKVNFFEAFEDAIKREVKEEIDVEIKIEKMLALASHIIPEESVHFVGPQYLCRIKEGQVKNLEPQKHTELKWFKLNEIPDQVSTILEFGLSEIK